VDYLPVSDNQEKVDEAVRLAAEPAGKTIVFVHSKITGKEIIKRLRSMGIRALFHNASVRPAIRAKMEAAFNDKMSGLNVLVSTSTLGAGVNVG
jgi:superfamily II helicase